MSKQDVYQVELIPKLTYTEVPLYLSCLQPVRVRHLRDRKATEGGTIINVLPLISSIFFLNNNTK
jgi:hypothetical protein